MTVQRGQSLAEYGMGLALVALVSAASLQNLGTVASTKIAGMGDSLANRTPISEFALPQGGTGSQNGSGNTGTGGNNQFDLDLSDYSDDELADQIELAGSSGTTTELARKLEQLAQQLEEAGDTDAADFLKRLAEQGHTTANAVTDMKSLIKRVVDHQYIEKPTDGSYWYNANQKAHQQNLQKFNNLKDLAMTQLDGYDPALIAAVEKLSSDIDVINTQFQAEIDQQIYNIHQYNLSGQSAASFNAFVNGFNNMENSIADRVTHIKSGQIGQAGSI